jgi:pyrroloquinoline quinone biosynthesis protein D
MRFRSDRSGTKGSGPPPVIPLDARPNLPRDVRLVYEKASRRWVLLSPKRAFKADTIAAEIVKRCTGEATIDAIVDDLAQIYSDTRGRILADVMAFLRDLSDKNLLEL